MWIGLVLYVYVCVHFPSLVYLCPIVYPPDEATLSYRPTYKSHDEIQPQPLTQTHTRIPHTNTTQNRPLGTHQQQQTTKQTKNSGAEKSALARLRLEHGVHFAQHAQRMLNETAASKELVQVGCAFMHH